MVAWPPLVAFENFRVEPAAAEKPRQTHQPGGAGEIRLPPEHYRSDGAGATTVRQSEELTLAEPEVENLLLHDLPVALLNMAIFSRST
jgi:hypothetical protein